MTGGGAFRHQIQLIDFQASIGTQISCNVRKFPAGLAGGGLEAAEAPFRHAGEEKEVARAGEGKAVLVELGGDLEVELTLLEGGAVGLAGAAEAADKRAPGPPAWRARRRAAAPGFEMGPGGKPLCT